MWPLLLQAARDRPDEVLLRDDHGRSLTASDLCDASERVAAGLLVWGVGPGDVVSWQLPTALEAPVLMLACARLGAVQNPVIPLLREREVGIIAAEVEPKAFVCPPTWRGFDHRGMARTLGLEVLEVSLDEPADELRLPTGDPSTLPPYSPPGDEECRWLYYSSGTTGAPKGTRHADATVTAASNGMVDQYGIETGDVYPIAWPLAHIGGVAMLATVLRRGGTLVLFETFDPATTPVRMAAHHPTILGSATPFFVAYVAAQRARGDAPLFPELRMCVGGGAPTPQEVNHDVADVLGVPGVAGAWGLTEFPVATGESPDTADVGTSVGVPSEGVDVRVVDGELRLKGPQCFLGYVDPSLDADAFDDEGWFRTGDLGSVDGAGRVHVDGRAKDVIIRNAENISATEVEEVLMRHPAVADVAVVGAPDPRTGERLVAVVVPAPDLDVDLAALVDHCTAAGLARYKAPERLLVLDILPRSSMGKVLKADLRTAVRGA